MPGVNLALVIGIRSLVASDDHPAERRRPVPRQVMTLSRQTKPGGFGPDWTSRLSSSFGPTDLAAN